jgi:YD repeat-containing protein
MALRPDPNVGDRGQTLWVQDAGYNDSTSPSYHKEMTYTYNAYGQKLTETNLNGVVTQYTYGTSGDDLGNLVQVVQDPGGTGHLNRTTTMHYDVMGRVLESIDPLGLETNTTYNTLGQPVTVTSYNVAGNVAQTFSYVYGANGRTSSVTDNRGTTSIAYEAGSDRVHSVTDPVTGTISYTLINDN